MKLLTDARGGEDGMVKGFIRLFIVPNSKRLMRPGPDKGLNCGDPLLLCSEWLTGQGDCLKSSFL